MPAPVSNGLIKLALPTLITAYLLLLVLLLPATAIGLVKLALPTLVPAYLLLLVRVGVVTGAPYQSCASLAR